MASVFIVILSNFSQTKIKDEKELTFALYISFKLINVLHALVINLAACSSQQIVMNIISIIKCTVWLMLHHLRCKVSLISISKLFQNPYNM